MYNSVKKDYMKNKIAAALNLLKWCREITQRDYNKEI